MDPLSFTFELRSTGSFFTHRDPATWLEDLARISGQDMTKFTATYVGRNDDVEVIGDEDALRWACVALNLHAEQAPWDSTPVEQAERLEAYLQVNR